MKSAESHQFDLVKVRSHCFASYHEEGTSNTIEGSHGNAACVQCALELDIGVFQISPVDKGGMLYKPSVDVYRANGTQLSPIAFVAL